ncbi:MAG TPA: RecX family transcriptional regulator [Acetobacteraceae bacterium]|nr:RecX family transcriptional regulator [Acetobacteraceae bacterium]
MAEAGPPPDRAALHAAALAHLSRYAATRAGLERVLFRRIARWARQAEGEPDVVAAARATAREVVERLVAAGAVDDASFAAARARRLARTGSSRARIAANLARHGVTGAALAAALPADELLAALALVRRRRLGPYRAETDRADPETARRELAALARAGFPHAIARAALAMPRAEAEERLAAARHATG